MARFLKHGIDAETKLQTDTKVRETVETILADLEARGDEAVREYSEKFDNWSPDSYRLSRAEIDACYNELTEQEKGDIQRQIATILKSYQTTEFVLKATLFSQRKNEAKKVAA